MHIYKGQPLWCRDGTRAVVQDVSNTHVSLWYKGEIVKHTIDLIGKTFFVDQNFPRRISLAEFNLVISKQKGILADEETKRKAILPAPRRSRKPVPPKMIVNIGDLVNFTYLDTGEICAYTIIDPAIKRAFNPVSGTISSISQLGKALLGKQKGDVFKFEAVSEFRQIRIIDFHSVTI